MWQFQSTPSGGKATPFEINQPVHQGFNPRLPGGRRRSCCGGSAPGSTFQSTPSGGKATDTQCQERAFSKCFNPRLPGGRRHTTIRSTVYSSVGFQSTPSGGKATGLVWRPQPCAGVSIHAFRGEGDSCTNIRHSSQCRFQSTPSGGKATRTKLVSVCRYSRFNPRLPGGRRPVGGSPRPRWRAFQSTPSGGKATLRHIHAGRGRMVSIHSFRGEGDSFTPVPWHGKSQFQSTPSGGKAT